MKTRRSGRVAALWLVLGSTPSARAEGPEEKVRVEYAAPLECPGKDRFLAEVRGRIGSDWEAPDGVLARTIEVRVALEAARSVARIEFTDASGRPITRSVSAETCPEVVSGIALVTALAIESRVAEAVSQSAPAEEPPRAAPPPIPPVMPATPPPSAPAPPQEAPRRAGPPPRIDVGSALVVSGGVGPELAVGPRLGVGLAYEDGPAFRLGGDYLATSLVDSHGGRARFSLSSVSLTGCPVVLAASRSLRFLPCAGVAAGQLHAEAVETPDYPKAGSASPGWVALLAAVRGRIAWDPLFAELGVEGRFPTAHHRFVLAEPGSAATPVYEVPWGALGVELGFGVRF